MPIQIATATLFIAATALAVSMPVPRELPAIALSQTLVYRVEILLALVYGGLLLLTPLLRGVLHGHLPIELSHRGAKWPEPADVAVAKLQEEVVQLEAEISIMKSKDSEDEEAK